MTQADCVFGTPPTNTSATNPPGPVDQVRRRLLTVAAGGAVAAAMSTAALPAIATPAADPIYAAIEAHRKAHAASRAALAEIERLLGVCTENLSSGVVVVKSAQDGV